MDSEHSDRIDSDGTSSGKRRGPTGPLPLPGKKKTAVLMAEIDRIQTEAGETWNAIRKKLSFDRLKILAGSKLKAFSPGPDQEVFDDIGHAACKLSLAMIESAKNNRMPPLLLSAGLSWFTVRSIRQFTRNRADNRWREARLDYAPAAGRPGGKASAGRAAEVAGADQTTANSPSAGSIEPLFIAGALFALGVTLGLILPDSRRHTTETHDVYSRPHTQ